MLVLFTDTDTDLTPEKAKEFGYHLISMPYSIDGKTTYPYEDFEHFDAHAFYDSLRSGILPKTSGISAERYKQYFEPHFKNGDDILYVHFSAAMTATFEAMNIAVKELLQEYPERKFYTIDTKAITILSLNIVEEIGDTCRYDGNAARHPSHHPYQRRRENGEYRQGKRTRKSLEPYHQLCRGIGRRP